MTTIRVLGTGCANCRTLTGRTRQALTTLAIDTDVVEVHDPVEIAAAGIMSTPALEIDGEIVLAGRVPDVARLEALLAERAAS